MTGDYTVYPDMPETETASEMETVSELKTAGEAKTADESKSVEEAETERIREMSHEYRSDESAEALDKLMEIRWSKTGTRDWEAGDSEEKEPPVLMVVSDTHYISREMHDDGRAFWRMNEEDDGKLNAYSDEILDELIRTAADKKPSALILTGDLTHNGERRNHERLAEKLNSLTEQGIPVLVIPGNHDIRNDNASTYFGDSREPAEYLHSPMEFYEIYRRCGYDAAVSRDPNSLSYVYVLDPEHWVIMLDSAWYEDGMHVDGRIREASFAWLETALRLAKENHIAVIPMAHHNLLSESRMYTQQCVLLNYDRVTALFEKYEIPLYVSGHLHAQRIHKHKKEPGVPEDAYGVTEIVLSSYAITPYQYGILRWDEQEKLHFDTEQTELPFDAAERQRQVIAGQVSRLGVTIPQNMKEEMADFYAQLYAHYCAGDGVEREEIKESRAYALWERFAPNSPYRKQITQMTEDLRYSQKRWSSHTQRKE